MSTGDNSLDRLARDFSIAEIDAQVDRILSSPLFANSERMERFLKFVVCQTLRGFGNELKEYVIGVEVFDRGEEFNPQVDSVVRGGARRLRSLLASYYSGLGMSDPVRIELPKGSYVPIFTANDPLTSPDNQDDSKVAAASGNAVRLDQRQWRTLAYVGACGLMVIATFLLTVVWTRQPDSSLQLPLRRFALETPAPIGSIPYVPLVAISPDGRRVAFIVDEGESRLWIRDLDRQGARPVEGSEGAVAPFWSPDSEMIGFSAAGELRKVPAKGGPPISICPAPPGYVSGASWSPDGRTIVFAAGSPSGLYSVPAGGGAASLLMSARSLEDESAQESLRLSKSSVRPGWIIHPTFLPVHNGKQFLLFSYNTSLVVRDLSTGRNRLVGDGVYPAYSPSGHLLYRSGTDIWGRRFSLEQARFAGEPFRVAHNATDPSVAFDGTLVYRDMVAEQLVWRDRLGAQIGTVGHPAEGMYYPALSADDHRITIETLENDNLDVWVWDILRGTRIRLTVHPATDATPLWSPEGEHVAYSSYRAGNTDIFVRRADAGSAEASLVATADHERVSDWSRDKKYILYSLAHPKNGHDLWYLRQNSEKKWEPHLLLQTSSNERLPKLSPDGRYVAYLSDESGRDEVYVRQFPRGDRRWPVSSHGGSQIRWSRSGKELFYAEAGALIAVSVSTNSDFAISRTTRLFSHLAFTTWTHPNYDVSADGQRILLPQKMGLQESLIQVVQNWAAEFRDVPSPNQGIALR